MSAVLLEARRLTLQVASRTLVRDLDFRIAPGELWCLLGPNGAGKTTLLHALVGLRDAQGGSVHMAGRPLDAWPATEAARRRSFLPQTFHDAFSASVLECVMLGRHPHLSHWQWEGDGDREVALSAMEQVDLAGFEQRDVLTLSGGERQRVALAALFAQDAPLLLLDEPVSHLDLHHQLLVLEHLRALARERGRGLLFAVHDLNLAVRFASHALLLAPNGTVRQGTVAEVMREDGLSEAFGHRVARIEAAGRTLFVPE